MSLLTKADSFIYTDYIINVKTSDRFGAGTDANVYIQLFGEKGESESFHLKNSKKANKFERNQLDQFTFLNEICIGNLKTIKIWHDNSGIGAAWHLEFVEISDTTSGLKFRFPCHRWLSVEEDDNQTSVELKCLEVTEGPKQLHQKADGVLKKPSDPSINSEKSSFTATYTKRGFDDDQTGLVGSNDNIMPIQAIEVHSVKASVQQSVYGPYHGKPSPLLEHRKHSGTEITKSPYGKYSHPHGSLPDISRRTPHSLNVVSNGIEERKETVIIKF